MKKLMISLAILASVAFAADKTVFDICNDKTCYTQILENVKSWEWKTDNVAINIAHKSKHPFSFVVPLDGSLQTFKAGHVSTGQSYNKSLNFI